MWKWIKSFFSRQKKMSNELAAFYSDINLWIMYGCQPSMVFKKKHGLCKALMMWLDFYYPHRTLEFRTKVYDEMQAQFQLETGNRYYPFNQEKKWTQYFEEHGKETMYDNPKRIAWIKTHQRSLK